MKGLIVAGTSSGIGKTTVTLAIMHNLSNVQPYKVGPDYIDPSHHKEITGKNSRNLDVHLMGREGVKRNYCLGKGDYGIIEGVMGLYDSYDESTAKIAEILDLPILLVLDASNGMESVAATALGFQKFADVDIRGVILNNVSSKKQEKGIKKGLKRAEIPCFGTIYYSNELEIPSRHLGLYMGKENKLKSDKLKKISQNLDMDAIKKIAKEKEFDVDGVIEYEDTKDVKIGIAYDEAFNFYYSYNLEILKRNSDVVFFSPLNDQLPEADGFYFGGGYPELHLSKLEENNKIKSQLLDQASRGKPVFAECGGFMYLSESIKKGGQDYQMSGVLPVEIEMTDSLQAVGYTKVKAKKELPIAKQGQTLKGHEFHYSKAYPHRDAKKAFRVEKGKGINGNYDGLVEYNSLGCYNHFHECSFSYLHKLVEEAKEKS